MLNLIPDLNNISVYSEFGGFGSVSGKIEIEIKINHEGEVNRFGCTAFAAVLGLLVPSVQLSY